MEEKKNSADPPDYRQSQSFKQNYAGTSIPKSVHEKQDSVGKNDDTHTTKEEPYPVELRNLVEWLRDPTSHNVITAVSAIAIVIVTVIYTVFAGLQWKETRDAVARASRAWIGVSMPVNITDVSNGPESSTVTYVVTTKNYGNSVASHLWISSKIVTTLEEITPTITDSCNVVDGYLTGSWGIKPSAYSKMATIANVPGELMFPSEEHGRWFRGVTFKRTTSIIFVVGCLVYKDQFGEIRHTKFANYMDSNTGDILAPKLPLLLYSAPIGNEAD